jgi:hypothetical protein
MTNLKLVVLLLLACGAWGQQAPAAFEGSWSASAGQAAGPKDIFHGRWSGQALPLAGVTQPAGLAASYCR